MQIYEIGLALCRGVGAQTAKKLLETIGNAEAIFMERKEAMQSIKGISSSVWNLLHASSTLERAEKEINLMQANSIKSIFYMHSDFPQRLKECNDSPILLFKKGDLDLNMPKTIAIVGTRRASRYGIEQTSKLISELQHDGVTIISGLAYGIDTQAHLSALDYQLPTLCVLGHGFDQIYPIENANLARRILEEGAWLSEYPWGTTKLPGLFPRRNRIVAGLSDAVVVIEASNKGGALITANIANSYNRDVFAIPGRNSEYYSQGCNSLIKKNQAILLQSANDIRDYMQWELYQVSERQKTNGVSVQLTIEQNEIVENIRLEDPISLETLSKRVKRNIPELHEYLLNLEIMGIIEGMTGGRYRIKHTPTNRMTRQTIAQQT